MERKFNYSEFKYGTNLNTMGKNALTAVKFRELCFIDVIRLVFNLLGETKYNLSAPAGQ